MTSFDAIVLGVVQGAAEFLPVSSSGHLVLFHELPGAAGEYALAYDAVLHLATALAVVVYFRRDIYLLAHTFLRMIGRLPTERKDRALVLALIAGTIPAVVAGLLLEDMMEAAFRAPLVVAGGLVFGSVLFIVAERRLARAPRAADLSGRKGFLIGLFQALALVPGVSRSGASIAGGLFLGLSRVEAARFAFLLAVPIMLGAGGKKLIELMGNGGEVSLAATATGGIVAFVVALAAIHFMLGFVRRHTLWPFIWYRFALAVVIVLVVLV